MRPSSVSTMSTGSTRSRATSHRTTSRWTSARPLGVLGAPAPQQLRIRDMGHHEHGDGLTRNDLASELRILVADEIQRLLVKPDGLLLRPAPPG